MSEEVKVKPIKLNKRKELFCQFYVKNKETFCNATESYAEAYDFKLDTLDTTREKDPDNPMKDLPSEYDRAYRVVAVEGSRLLRKVDIQDRITQLFNELLRNDIVDGELSKLIVQDSDWDVKVAAIKEFNKLKARITEKVDHTTLGKEIPAPIMGGFSTGGDSYGHGGKSGGGTGE